MLRRPLFSLLFVSALFVGAWQFVPAQPPKGGVQQGQNVPQQVQDKLEELKKLKEEKKWTFDVGHSKAAEKPITALAASRLPPKVDLPMVSAQVNVRGSEWLKADHKARDKFDKKNPGVLPGKKVAPRTNPEQFRNGNKFDWRDVAGKNYVTAVRDQQSCGSCWDFTALGAFECNYLIRNNKSIDVAEQQIICCANSGTCAGGWWMGVFDYLIKHGAGPESSYPYENKDCNTCKAVTSPYKAASWGFVAPDGKKPTPDAIKNALLKHGPLAVAVNVTTAFQHYKSGVFNEHATGNINHGVVLVGWDDSKGKNGAWVIRNSWGTGWGDNGYMWIEYDCNMIGDHAAWVEAKSEHYEVMILLANDYKVKQGQEIIVPLHLLNPTNVKNMNWKLTYNPSIATLIEPKVVQGNLPITLFEANPRTPPDVLMGFAQTNPITIDGTVAALRFKAVGPPGSMTPLTLHVSKVNNPEGEELPIKLIHGMIEIVKDHKEIPPGSCYGRDYLGIEDARCALQMSVLNRPVSLQMDMDNDGQVTSRDAAIIIQRVADQVRTGQ